MKRIHQPDLTIMPMANGYLVQEVNAVRSGQSLHTSHVFESMKAALEHIATEMNEKVSVYDA